MHYDRMTLDAQAAFAEAHALASSLGHSVIDLDHLLMALLLAEEGPLRQSLLETAEDATSLETALTTLTEAVEARLQAQNVPLEDLIGARGEARYISQALVLTSDLAVDIAEKASRQTDNRIDVSSGLVTPHHLVQAAHRCADIELRELLSPLLTRGGGPRIAPPSPPEPPILRKRREGEPGTEDWRALKSPAPPPKAQTPATRELSPREPVAQVPTAREPSLPVPPEPPSAQSVDLSPLATPPPFLEISREITLDEDLPSTSHRSSGERDTHQANNPDDTGEDAPPPQVPNADSALARFTQDLTERARAGKLDPIVGRDQEIRRIIQVLCRRSKNNPVLIGEPGVGKTAIAEGLALRIVNGDVPEGLRNQRLLSLDLGALLAGARFRGDFEERLKQLLEEVIHAQDGVILFIDELHTLMGAGGGEGAIDAANLLKPALARGELRCIGATTLDEYRRHVEKDAALERRFQPVQVAEPSVEDALSILRGLRERYELHHGVRIQDRALVAAVQLSHRYLLDRFLPDKAIDLMDEAAARIRVELDSAPAILDTAERRLIQLEIERQALSREDDRHSRERLLALAEELSNAREEVELLRTHWGEEKALISRLRELQEELGRNRANAERALREQRLEQYVALEDERGELLAQMSEVRELLETLQGRQRLLREEVSAEDIAEVVARWTGLPVARMLEAEVDRVLKLEERLRTRVLGQEEALKRVASAIRRSRAGLNDANRPLGSFLFLGPTGVGKTEMARALADILYTDPKALLRLDMSEFMERHSIARLLGSPPGYVGYEEGSILSKAIRQRPWSVVLFDEAEKAHPDFFHLLLQLLDDGFLTDSQGRRVDFRNTLVVLTSNLGAGEAIEGEPTAVTVQKVLQAVRAHFRPELLNRLDELLVFKPLGTPELTAILELHLQRLRNKLQERRIQLEVSPAARARLLQEGHEPAYGARPMARAIQRMLKDPLSMLLLQELLPEGSVVMVDVGQEEGPLRFMRRSG